MAKTILHSFFRHGVFFAAANWRIHVRCAASRVRLVYT